MAVKHLIFEYRAEWLTSGDALRQLRATTQPSIAAGRVISSDETGRRHMKLRYLLAALPFLGIYSGGALAAKTTFVFGLPFLLVWNLFWMGATAAILAIIYCLDSRDEAANAGAHTGGEK
jgi:hypothetical protein